MVNGTFNATRRALDLRHDSEIVVNPNTNLIVAQDLLFSVCLPEGYAPLDQYNMNGVPASYGVRSVSLIQSENVELDLIFSPDLMSLSGDLDGRIPGSLYVSIYVVKLGFGGRPSVYEVQRFFNYDVTSINEDALPGGNQSTLADSYTSDADGAGKVLWKSRYIMNPTNYSNFFAAATWWSQWTYDPLHVVESIPSSMFVGFDNTGLGDYSHQNLNSVCLLFSVQHYVDTVNGSLAYNVPQYGRLTCSVRHSYLDMWQQGAAPPPHLKQSIFEELQLTEPLTPLAATQRDKRSRDSPESSTPAVNSATGWQETKKAKVEEEIKNGFGIYYFFCLLGSRAVRLL